MKNHARVIVKGSPITKSNFKLSNKSGRSILPYASGKYHDRYAIYEEQIAFEARCQNPNIVLTQSLIAILKVYYKSKKRHPDTTNIPKSIFDGIEKSGLIINDAQIRRLVIEEYYDSENPRFELELFGESDYDLTFGIKKNSIVKEQIDYEPPANKKTSNKTKPKKATPIIEKGCCEICGKVLNSYNTISANKGQTLICKDCFEKLF
ncbi:RusA family crossover junction endodeoxyribonuclease [Clostridium sp. DL1XJH146]